MKISIWLQVQDRLNPDSAVVRRLTIAKIEEGDKLIIKASDDVDTPT